MVAGIFNFAGTVAYSRKIAEPQADDFAQVSDERPWPDVKRTLIDRYLKKV